MKIKKRKKTKRFNVERGLLSKLIETEDLKTVKDAQIKATFFTGENRRIFSFINKSLLDTGEFPTIRAIERKFPAFDYETYDVNGEEAVGTEESLAYWCKEIRWKNIHNTLAEAIEKEADLLDKGDTKKAQEIHEQTFFRIENNIEIHERTDLTSEESAEERIERYLNRKQNKGVVGIPTGISQLDFLLKGLVADTLTTLIAKTGIGKTWILVLVGAYAMLNNYKVMVFVTEMSRDLMEDRFDAVLFGMMYDGFSYSDFKSGNLSADIEDNFFHFLRDDMTKMTNLVIEDAPDLATVISGVQREKPDLVLVDSAYLMDDGQKTDSDWLRVAHITRGLKKDVAKRFHIPVFINSQADKSTSRKTGPAMDNISFTQSVGMDSDNVLSAYRDDVMYAEHEMGIGVLKNREGSTGKTVINWDFKIMNFEEIYGVTDDSEDVDNQSDMRDNVLSVDD